MKKMYELLYNSSQDFSTKIVILSRFLLNPKQPVVVVVTLHYIVL